MIAEGTGRGRRRKKEWRAMKNKSGRREREKWIEENRLDRRGPHRKDSEKLRQSVRRAEEERRKREKIVTD